MIHIFEVKNIDQIPNKSKAEIIKEKPYSEKKGIFILGKDKDQIFILISKIPFESTAIEVVFLYFKHLGICNNYVYLPVWNNVYSITIKTINLTAKCKKCGGSTSEKEHTCAYLSDMHDDKTTLCNCCDACETACAKEV